MRWFEKLARYWESREDGSGKWVYTIMDREGKNPYLIRYYLLDTRWIDKHEWSRKYLGWASFRLTLHHTLQSDELDGLHDHPWVFWGSLILSGGYWESTPEGRFWRAPGSFRFRPAKALHRLELDPSNPRKEVYSIFLMGRRVKDWGFLSRTGDWIPHEEYLANRNLYFDPAEAK